MRCPTCDSEIEDTVTVDLDLNTIASRGGSIILSPLQAEVAYILVKKMPRVVDMDSLIIQVWGQKEPEDPKNSFNVTLHDLRKKIETIGLSIKNLRGRGYLIHENHH
jgi:DNA-binding response OmpR family regulator